MTITVWLHWLITFNENHRLCVLATGVWILLMWRPFHGYVFPQFLPADGGVAVFERVRLSQHFRPSLRLRREFRWVCKWLDSVLFSVVIMVANNFISKPFIISLMWNTNKSMFLNTKLIIGLPKYVKYACNFIENSFFFYRNSEMVLIFCQTLYGAKCKSEKIPTTFFKKLGFPDDVSVTCITWYFSLCKQLYSMNKIYFLLNI